MNLDQFQLNDPKKLFAELTAFALQGKNSKFELITSLHMRGVCRIYKRGMKRVIKIFKSLRDTLIQAYKEAVNSGKILPDDVEMMTAIRNFDHCYKFYRQELNTVKDMLNEYHFYMWDGHNVKASYLGKRRSLLEMYDYRKKQFTFKCNCDIIFIERYEYGKRYTKSYGSQ